MITIPTGTELSRPFLPAKDFDLSRQFYTILGFELLLDGDVAIFGVGAGSFILQRYYQKEWAENFMMQLMVDDLDAWWAHISSLDLPGRFKVREPLAPALQPWGPASPTSPIPAACCGTSPNDGRAWHTIADERPTDARFAVKMNGITPIALHIAVTVCVNIDRRPHRTFQLGVMRHGKNARVCPRHHPSALLRARSLRDGRVQRGQMRIRHPALTDW
jgi:hypothetical protein